jgi:two-component system NtrC family sensor kinase
MKKQIRGLTAILDAMEDGIYISSQDYTIDFMNKPLVRDFDMGIGKKCYQVLNRSEKICSQCRAQEVFEEGETIRWKKYISHVNKTYEITELPVKNEDGTVSKLTIYRDITRRKKDEEKIKAYKADYSQLFEHVGCGVYISTKEGRFVNANQALLDMLGYKSEEEFLKIDIIKDLYLRPDDRRKFQEMIERDGRVIDYEVNLKRKDGSPIPILLTSHVRHDQKGIIIGYEGIMVDQTQRKQMEEDYRRLFEHVGCGVFISTKEGKFLNANQALLDMLGYNNKEEFLKIDITKDLYLRPDDRRRFRDLIERDGRVIDYEVDFQRKDGKPISVLLTGHVRYDQHGNVLGYEGLNVDQTQRKQMERELKEAHDFLNKIIQNSPNAIMAADLKGNIMIWNQGAEEILGYRAKDVIYRMNLEDIYPKGIAGKILEMMRSPEYGGLGKLRYYPLSYERHDGEIVEGNLSAAIIYDTKGHELAFVSLFVDLKERLDMERKLRQTQEQLLQSEKLASIGRLSAGVAHEINNPLTTILTSAMLIQEDIDSADQIYNEMKTISDETLRCRKIVTSLLDFARQSKPTKKLNDLNKIVKQSFGLTRKQAAFQDVIVELNLSENLPDTYLDKDQIQQSLINLTLNAIEATDSGGKIRLTTLYDSKTNTIEILIRDTGIGIQPENMDKIFDPFFTTTEGGTGLGLAVTHGIIEQHGGTINVESTPGQGTCFTIRLPLELGS